MASTQKDSKHRRRITIDEECTQMSDSFSNSSELQVSDNGADTLSPNENVNFLKPARVLSNDGRRKS